MEEYNDSKNHKIGITAPELLFRFTLDVVQITNKIIVLQLHATSNSN